MENLSSEQWRERLQKDLLVIPGVDEVRPGKHGLVIVVKKPSEMYFQRCKGMVEELFEREAPDLPFRLEVH